MCPKTLQSEQVHQCGVESVTGTKETMRNEAITNSGKKERLLRRGNPWLSCGRFHENSEEAPSIDGGRDRQMQTAVWGRGRGHPSHSKNPQTTPQRRGQEKRVESRYLRTWRKSQDEK